MAEYNIEIMHGSARELLKSQHIWEAIDVIEKMGQSAGARKELEMLSGIRDTYGYMTYYMTEGMADEGREKMHRELTERLRQIADSILRLSRSVSEPDYYSSQLRLVNLRKERIGAIMDSYSSLLAEMSLTSLAGTKDGDQERRRYEMLERMFSVVYTSMGDKEEYQRIVKAVTNKTLDKEFEDLTVSAMTIGLLSYYDRYKFSALMDIYEQSTENRLIAAKALAGIVLTMGKYPHRIEEDSEISNRLMLWQDSLEVYRDLRETIRVIISTRDTDRVATKMKEEVLPELMKQRPEILKKLGELQNDPESVLENNPEWEEMLEKSGLSKKMRELSEMQSEGADLMMVTFSNLKQFPFFNNATNWFIPFTTENPALSDLGDDLKSVLESMTELNESVCHSDMYSLALAMKQMPVQQREMVSGQFSQQLQQIKEETKDARLHSSAPEFDMELLRTVRDLYRFYKLFRYKKEMENPFENPLDFMGLPIVGIMMAQDEVLEIIGEFYFKRGYYKEALPILQYLSESKSDDATIYEKIGFCYQQLKNYEKAEEAYGKAELLREPGPWLLKKMAYVSKRLGNYDKASEYYSRLLENDPENFSLLLQAGHTELERENLSGALAHYYHANYLNPEDRRILRAIGWIELLNRNYEKSEKYYRRIESTEKEGGDWLNLGHALYLQGRIKEASEAYRKAAEGDIAGFISAFESDIETLEPLGMNRREAHIIIDGVTRPYKR